MHLSRIGNNLNQIAQNLILVATNPSQAAQANIVLQNEVAGLRNNAARLPRPCPSARRRPHKPSTPLCPQARG